MRRHADVDDAELLIEFEAEEVDPGTVWHVADCVPVAPEVGEDRNVPATTRRANSWKPSSPRPSREHNAPGSVTSKLGLTCC
jgi:hypothetical protein